MHKLNIDMSHRAFNAAQHEQQHNYNSSPVLAYKCTEGVSACRKLQIAASGKYQTHCPERYAKKALTGSAVVMVLHCNPLTMDAVQEDRVVVLVSKDPHRFGNAAL